MPLGTGMAFVTGGASGIGLAITNRLAADGRTVVVADVDDDSGERCIAAARAAGYDVYFRHLDVTSESDVDETIAAVARDHGALDVLVNNAGIQVHHPIVDLTTEEWNKVLGVNLQGAFYCLRAAGRLMLKQGAGSIVNIASVAAERGPVGRAPYAVSKSGIVALTRVAAAEWSVRGVRVNAIAPGYVDTPMLRGAYELGTILESDVLRRIPAGRLAQADEIANVVSFLASPEATYITGVVLPVDGGFLIDYGVPLQDRVP
jgi:3-oxoacyl-[acyl-carrier protein] reductase